MVAVIIEYKMEEFYEADQTALHAICMQQILLPFVS